MRDNKNWRDWVADNTSKLLFGGLIFLAGLAGCAPSQNNAAADQAANAPNVQPAPPTEPSSGVAQQNFNEVPFDTATSVCKQKFPRQPGSLFNLESCLVQAGEKYIFSAWSAGAQAIMTVNTENNLEAAKQVDNGTMNMQEYDNYELIISKIYMRELNELDISSQRQEQEYITQNSINYDTEKNPGDVASDERQMATLKLQDQQQTLYDDRDEYEYCAGLHEKNPSECDTQKIAFQTDLATYQAMAASIPEAPQSTSQSAPNNLQQEDIQDDLDAIAGGVVP